MGWASAVGGSTSTPLAGFRVSNNAQQAITGNTDIEVDWQTVELDTHSGFAANVFTVPAALNGKYMQFAVSVIYLDVENQKLYLHYDNGGGYNVVARSGNTTVHYECMKVGPFLLNTGDKYRVIVNGTSGAFLEDNAETFFRGWVVG